MKWDLDEVETLPNFVKQRSNRSWDEIAAEWNAIFGKNRTGESLRGKDNQIRWGWKPQRVCKSSCKRRQPRTRRQRPKKSKSEIKTSPTASPGSEESCVPPDNLNDHIDERQTPYSYERGGENMATRLPDEDHRWCVTTGLSSSTSNEQTSVQVPIRGKILPSKLMPFLVGLVILLGPHLGHLPNPLAPVPI